MIRKNKKENVVGTKSGSTGWHNMYHESHSPTAPFSYSQEYNVSMTDKLILDIVGLINIGHSGINRTILHGYPYGYTSIIEFAHIMNKFKFVYRKNISN